MMVQTPKAGEGCGGRNRPILLPETKKKRRDWRRLGAYELDSSGVENKDIEAHLSVPSERRGVVCGGGAMVRTVEAVGVFSVREEKGHGG
jgi:hypothetical protein